MDLTEPQSFPLHGTAACLRCATEEEKATGNANGLQRVALFLSSMVPRRGWGFLCQLGFLDQAEGCSPLYYRVQPLNKLNTKVEDNL